MNYIQPYLQQIQSYQQYNQINYINRLTNSFLIQTNLISKSLSFNFQLLQNLLNFNAFVQTIGIPTSSAIRPLGSSLDVNSSKSCPSGSAGSRASSPSSRYVDIHNILFSAWNPIAFSNLCVFDVGNFQIATI